MLALIRHSYRDSSPLAIAGLGFAGLAAARDEFGFALPAEPGAAAFGPLFGAANAAVLALALALNLVCRTCALRCPALATFLDATSFAGTGFAPDGPAVFAVKAGDGLGVAVMRVIRAAGFTPAAMAFLAAPGEIAGCFAAPCKSGLTMICRS
jgi:hypothetical protein